MKSLTPHLVLTALLLALGACAPAAVSDAGPERKDAGVESDAGREDAGPDDDDGGPAAEDGGPVGGDDAGPPPGDAGPPPDAGVDAGVDAGPADDDEAGDLTDAIDVQLPYYGVFNHIPAGDSDCVRFTVDEPGVLLAEGSNLQSDDCSSTGGSSLDTKLYLYLDGETSTSASIASDDQGGPGNCPRLERSIGAGTYIVCSSHWSSFSPSPVPDATLDIQFTPFVCGNGIVELGEECDGVEACTGACLFDDGLPREDEVGGNDAASEPGVLDMALRQIYRGQAGGGADEDWWRLELPGGFGPGAVEVFVGGPDTSATSCGSASGLRLDVFSAGDLSEPVGTSRVAAPCRVVTLTSLLGDIIFGNEVLYVRVRTTGEATPYHVYATYIEEDCGDGVVQPSEECEPGVGPSGVLCNEATCRLERPGNDLCNQAQDISADLTTDGTVVGFEGSTVTATNATSYTGTGFCQSSSADHVDVHYTFLAPGTGRMAFILDSIGWDAALYATEGECGEAITCKDTPEEIEIDVVAGERYTIVVDSYSTSKGPYTLDALFLAPPPNDTCETALTLVLPDDGTPVTASGTTRGASDTSSATGCTQNSTAAHRDVFYKFTAPSDGVVKATIEGNFSERIYAFEGCGGDELDCGATSIDFDVVAGTTYFIAVDSYGTDAGEYDLTARYDIPPPPLAGGATCQAATALTEPWGFVLGNLDGMGDDYNITEHGGCTGYASIGPDTVYSINLAAGQSLTVVVDYDEADGSLYILDECPPGANACVDGQDSFTPRETVSITNSTGGSKNYWIVVDEWTATAGSADGGAFEMEWTVTGP